MAEPKSQHHRHSTQTGRDLQRSPLQSLAQSRLSCEVRPGCSGCYPMGVGNLQEGDSTISLGPSTLPSHSCGGKSFLYLPPLWPCSVHCPPGPRTFCPELPLAPPALLPELCLSGMGLHSALAQIAWRPHQPLHPAGPNPSAQWLCHQEHRLVPPSLGSPVNMTGMHLVTSPGHWWEAALGVHLFQLPGNAWPINHTSLSQIIQPFLFVCLFDPSGCALIQTITSQLRRILWETVTKAMLMSR